ncbi:MAG: hypothetical protein PHF85_04040 [Bacilli bacterium]|nr:hypothetical protein [Bacilli bacterium]
MNKLMRKLSISILAVVFAVVAMGATTFAWFTITNTAKINQFEVQVTAGSGFEIAVTTVEGVPSAWKSTITKEEVKAAIGSNVVLKDLTSEDGETFYPISKIGVDVGVNGTDDYKLGTVATDGYAEFDIHFRSKAVGTVKLNMTETDITSEGKTKVADVAFAEAYTGGESFTATSNVLAYAMNAARMAIIGSSTVILEKAGATANAAETLDNTVGFGTAHAKGALAYYIAKNQIDTTDMDLSGVGTGPGTVKFLDTAYDTAVASIVTGPDNDWYTGKITVRIWLEGWDAECLNVIFSDTLQVKIQFEYES